MKKSNLIFVLTAVAVAICGCTKNMPIENSTPKEIKFLTANYATKAETGLNASTKFQGTSFGVYSWDSEGGDTYFMENALVTEQVEVPSGKTYWKPVETYYWPKDGKLDFVSYYPYMQLGRNFSVSRFKISYINFNVKEDPLDLMYADKAVGFSAKDSESGVPALFNHALSKVAVKVAKSYGSKTTIEGDGSTTITRWDVHINSASFVGAECDGSADFTLQDTKAFGIQLWEKPSQTREIKGKEITFDVWTPGKHTFDEKLAVPAGGLQLDVLKRDELGNVTGGFKELMPFTYVIPQMLFAGKQRIKISYTIDTYQTIGGVESLFNTETYVKSVDLIIPTEIEAWQINQSITYYIMIAPTRSQGNGGQDPGDPWDPDYPIDPNNPDLSDVCITFDPVVDGWHNLNGLLGL